MKANRGIEQAVLQPEELREVFRAGTGPTAPKAFGV